MKALLFIFIGPLLAFGSLYLTWISHIHQQGLGVIGGIVGFLIGIGLTLTGLTRNHRDHTRR